MRYTAIIEAICSLSWHRLTRQELGAASRAYYYFSVQFRENLLLAQTAHPGDADLARLVEGECDTANLSPYPAVAEIGERMNHDEFMWRSLALPPFGVDRHVDAVGVRYLAEIRACHAHVRVMSIPSYEDGGLEQVFTAMLDAPDWGGASLMAFRHFLVEHIGFDADAGGGHGALIRHIPVDDRVTPLWEMFYRLLADAVPSLCVADPWVLILPHEAAEATA